MGSLSSLATMGADLALQREAQQNQARTIAKERERDLRDIMARDAEQQRLAQGALGRRLAEERARAGAAGVGTSGGSADAVLRGLEAESAATAAARTAEIRRKLQIVDDTFAGRKRQNLLDFSSRLLDAGTAALGGGGSRRNLLDCVRE